MELKFILGNGNNGISINGLAEIIRVAGLAVAQITGGEEAVPRCDDEAIARNVLEEHEGIGLERFVEQKLGVVEAQSGLHVLINQVNGERFRVERTLAAVLTEQPLTEEQAEIDEGEAKLRGDLMQQFG